MPGPAPKLDPTRRHSRVGPRRLPPEGRKGPTPRWPLVPSLPLAAEAELWRQLWHTPQAAAWEELGWTRTVARYAKVLLRAEDLDMPALAEARQLEDRLGLTPKAMRMLLWEIARDEVAEKRGQAPATSARTRIKAVS